MIGSHSIRYLNHDPSQQWRSGINVSSNLNQNLAESGSLIVSAPRWKTYDFFWPISHSNPPMDPAIPVLPGPEPRSSQGTFLWTSPLTSAPHGGVNNGDPCRIWSRGCRVEADSKHHLRLSGTDTVHIYKFKYRCTYWYTFQKKIEKLQPRKRQ